MSSAAASLEGVSPIEHPPDSNAADTPVVPEARAAARHEGEGLAKRAVNAGKWTGISFVVDQGLAFVSNIMLVYFAVPREAFGLMALILTINQGLTMFSDVGIAPCLIQNEREDPAFYNTAWTMQTVRGVVLWVVACLLSYPVSQWRDDWAPLMYLLPVASLTVLINGFQSTAWITAQRQLNIRIMSLIRAGVAVFRIASMAVIAWFSPTAWALVGGLVVNALLLCIASHFMIPAIKNRFYFEKEAFWSLIKYGRWLFLSTVITFFAGQLDKLLLGSLISVTALGVFYIGARFADLAPVFFKQVGQMVGFPALSDVYRRDEERFKTALLKMRLVLTLPINVFLLGMIAGGPMITWLFYGNSPTPGFIEAGWIIQVLCFNSLAGMVTTSYGHVFMASGRTLFNTLSVAVQVVVMAVCLLTGYHLAQEKGFILAIGVTQWVKYASDAAMAKACGVWQWKFDAAVLISCGLLAWVALQVSEWLAWRFVL